MGTSGSLQLPAFRSLHVPRWRTSMGSTAGNPGTMGTAWGGVAVTAAPRGSSDCELRSKSLAVLPKRKLRGPVSLQHLCFPTPKCLEISLFRCLPKCNAVIRPRLQTGLHGTVRRRVYQGQCDNLFPISYWAGGEEPCPHKTSLGSGLDGPLLLICSQ